MGTENTESLDGVVLQPMLCRTESGEPRSAHWRSEANVSPPKRVQIVDDTLTADTAYRLACEGTAMPPGAATFRMHASCCVMARRIDRRAEKPLKAPTSLTCASTKTHGTGATRARIAVAFC